jgi:hypothetical protein
MWPSNWMESFKASLHMACSCDRRIRSSLLTNPDVSGKDFHMSSMNMYLIGLYRSICITAARISNGHQPYYRKKNDNGDA